MQRGALGCKVDGGQHKIGSYTHADAEVIAATVAGLPDRLGGIRMAIRVAELARAGLTPDWMPGVVPRCVPVETKCNQHGERSTTVVVGTERVLTRGKWRTVDVLACPVTWRPQRNAQMVATNGSGLKAKQRRKAQGKPTASPDELAAFYAAKVNSDEFLPASMISNAICEAMLARGLVTTERLRSRGVL